MKTNFDCRIGKLKRYTDDFYRVVENKIELSKSIEEHNNIITFEDVKEIRNCVNKRGIFNDEKMAQSLSRTRSTIFEIMMCNEWEYFCTFTLNGEYQKRDNIDVFRKKFTAWLKNYNARNNCTIQYIFIPEKHKDGINWHGHGAIMGLPVEHLTAFKLTENIPRRLKTLIKQGREIYNWNAYADKFGFVSLERIQSHEATAKYVTKYITKNMSETDIEVNKRMFYASQGLKRAEILHEGEVLQEYQPDFENDYVKVKSFSSLDEALDLFAENERGGADNEQLWKQ
jgi:hypothetical protein